MVEERALRSPAGVRRDAVARRALGYVSVWADANGTAQAELARQAETIRCACEARGLELVAVARDLETPPRADAERPGLRHVLGQISAGEASCVVVEGLDRLGPSAAAVGTVQAATGYRRPERLRSLQEPPIPDSLPRSAGRAGTQPIGCVNGRKMAFIGTWREIGAWMHRFSAKSQ
jgi:hypothetical protein